MWWSPNSDCLPAAEGVECHRHGDRDVDANHADLDVMGEGAGGITIAGEDSYTVGVVMGMDQIDGLGVVLRRTTDKTGPKISSRQTVMSGVTLSIKVGPTK